MQAFFPLFALLVATAAAGPLKCPSSTPPPDDPTKCSLKAPTDPEFADICKPGATGHAGGAEEPTNRCPRTNYKVGEVFHCGCCGAPLFKGETKYGGPSGDGWPAFHGNGSLAANGTTNACLPDPGGTEVVCSTCGSHLGDYFPAGNGNTYDYYCIDGVCMLPPGAPPGKVCPAGQVDAVDALQWTDATEAQRTAMREAHAHHAEHHHHHH